MFGWEFPPHISGGLGTACFGLTKGMAKLNKVEVIFVVPKAFGDENPADIQLIGANQVPVAHKEIQFEDEQQKIDYFEVESKLIPYVGEEEFWNLKSKVYSKKTRFIETDSGLRVDFTGKYDAGLLEEIRNYAWVAEIIARNNPFDIIHAHDWLAYPAGMAAKKISGKPLVIHVHATDFDRSGGSVNPRVYAIEREGMEMADKIIAVSELTKNIIVEKYDIPSEKITVVYNAVEPVLDGNGVKYKKGFDEKVVTFLGRITAQKGPEYFVEAAHLLLKKINKVRFVMAGSGDLMNQMIVRVAELGISDHFHFTGFLKGKDVAHMLQITDVFVMPSVSEPFGIVPLEAMQFNVPVIISNQSGVAEVIKNAIKIDFWDTLEMADAIYGLLNYSALADYFKNEGKHEVEQLEWVNSAREVTEVYKSLVQF
ncbi:glycosyltransferase family 4 protein [Draconibacterium sp.]